MIVLGIVLVILGYWFLPTFLPQVLPAELDRLLYGFGVLLIVIGLVFWIFGRLGRPVGGRRNWY